MMPGSRKAAEIIASMVDFPANYGGTINVLALIIDRETGCAEMLKALEWILPLAESYLKSAPTHPDNAKLETARDVIRKARGE